jgi:hypothetical protein
MIHQLRSISDETFKEMPKNGKYLELPVVHSVDWGFPATIIVKMNVSRVQLIQWLKHETNSRAELGLKTPRSNDWKTLKFMLKYVGKASVTPQILPKSSPKRE